MGQVSYLPHRCTRLSTKNKLEVVKSELKFSMIDLFNGVPCL